jgi:hypothetical protein
MSETPIITRARRRHIPEEGNLQCDMFLGNAGPLKCLYVDDVRTSEETPMGLHGLLWG